MAKGKKKTKKPKAYDIQGEDRAPADIDGMGTDCALEEVVHPSDAPLEPAIVAEPIPEVVPEQTVPPTPKHGRADLEQIWDDDRKIPKYTKTEKEVK